MKLLIPQETLQQKLEQRVQSRREKGRFLNRRDGAALLLAIGCLLLGAVICFAPLHQKDYAPVGSFSAAAQAEPININTASLQALCSLPGIGSKKAQRILEDIRQNGPYKTLAEVARVPGISEAMIQKWQGLAVTH